MLNSLLSSTRYTRYITRSYAVNTNNVAGNVKTAARSAVGKAQQAARSSDNVANDLGGLPKHPDRSLLFGIKQEIKTFKEDVLNENAQRFASQANETSKNISQKWGKTGIAGNVLDAAKAASSKAAASVQDLQAKGKAGVAGNVIDAVKAASSKATASVQDLQAKGKATLNEALDVAEDKLGEFREPRPKQPVNPKIDVLAEEDINDLLDELEDKVRGLDHVKEAVADPKIRGALGLDAKTQGQPGKHV